MKKQILAVLLSAALTSGCTQSAPSCSDQKTIDLVKQIVQKKIDEKMPGTEVKFDIEAIRTTGKDDRTGTQSCVADFTMEIPKHNVSNKSSITFTSEKTDKGEHYVSVQGF